MNQSDVRRETGLIKQRTRLDEGVVNVTGRRLMRRGSGQVVTELQGLSDYSRLT